MFAYGLSVLAALPIATNGLVTLALSVVNRCSFAKRFHIISDVFSRQITIVLKLF